MNRLQITCPDGIQKTMDMLYEDLAHRNAAAPEGNCPVEQTAALVNVFHKAAENVYPVVLD